MPVTSTRRFAAEQADRLLRIVSAQISRNAKSSGADEVHDLRVAIRHFRRILSVLKPCYPRNETRRLRRALDRVMEKAGAVRDHDIALVLYARLGPFDSPSDNGSGGIVRELQERRARSAELLAMSLRQWETDDLISAWRHALSSAAEPAGAQARYWGTPAADTAKAILPAMAKDHFRAGKEAARGKASVDRLHRFRSAARNLRYTLDTFAPLYGKALARLGKQLRAVQDLLGEIHDCSATRRMLADKKETCGKGRRKFLAALKNRQSRKTKEFRKKYGAEFSSADALKRWTSSLRRTGAAKSAPQSSGR